MASLDGARLLGSYQLLSQLAVGGMAEIYVAKTKGVGGFEKLVALKVIHPNYSADPEFVQMLVDEAKLSVQLTHANIVQTFDLGRVDEQYYIAMELIDGLDLYKLLRRASELEIDFPFEVAAFIASEVSSGLDYAHRKRDAKGRPLKIVHRDVSPQNVLVSYDGEVKIVDFGIAKAAMRSQQTAAGVIKGKYYYMSPEQAWGDPIDARSDIFSAGILLYEMIVGQMLYLEEDLEKLLDVVRKANIQPPSSKRMGVPRELEAIVMKALKKRADERWQTASELTTALQQFVRGFAPDFTRARLATFVREVMGDDPTAARRDPRSSTAHSEPNQLGMVSAIEVRDENSLIFSLDDLKNAPGIDSEPQPLPRRADVATNVRGGGDFEENEQTIVDGGSATLMAHMGVGVGDDDRTRPAGPAVRRSGPGDVPSGQFDLGADDPAAEANTPALDASDDDATTGARKMPPLQARTYETRRVDNPPLREQDATPQAVVNEPLSIAPTVPREGRPPSQKVATASPQPKPPSQKVAQISAQPNAPAAPLDDASTREQRTRKATNRPVSFNDEDAAEPTVAARGARPPSQKVQPAPQSKPLQVAPPSPPPRPQPTPPPPTVPQATPEQSTLMMPPSMNPVANPPSRSNPKLSSFEEPTRIPAPQPPPLDSGRYVPGLDDIDPLSSLAMPPDAEALRRSGSRGVWIAVALLTVIAIGAAAAVMLAGTADPGRGMLSVVSLPPGAEVRVDGVAGSRETPLVLPDVDPKISHHVRVSKAGYDVWESDVKFPTGEREVRVQAVLMPIVGTVEISSTPPGAEAIVNGRIRGMTPTTVGDLPPNDDVQIEVRLRGYKVAHQTVKWAGKRSISVSIPLEKAK